MVDGRLHTNRSLSYGLLLVLGQWPDFWPVLFVQSALTIWLLALTLRAHQFGGRPLLLLAIVAAPSVLTTLPWLSAILLTDIFAGRRARALSPAAAGRRVEQSRTHRSDRVCGGIGGDR